MQRPYDEIYKLKHDSSVIKIHPRGKVFDLWSGFVTFDRFLRGFYRAARSHFGKKAVLKFYDNLEPNLLNMMAAVEAGTYQWGPYHEFQVMEPKPRIIEAAPFRDRIVHQAIHEKLEPIFEPIFYEHSYACRKGHGTHKAVERLQSWLVGKPDMFYLKMDVAKFFASVDREILFGLICRKISDKRFLSMIHSLILNAPGSIGIPIGNLTSQLFANLYLNHLDQFIKRRLQVKCYIRYMDDFILVDRDRKKLEEFRWVIEDFVSRKLNLRLHPHKVALDRVSQGITFLGYLAYPTGINVRGKTIRRFRKKLRENITLDSKMKRLLSFQSHLSHARNSKRLSHELGVLAFQKESFSRALSVINLNEGRNLIVAKKQFVS